MDSTRAGTGELTAGAAGVLLLLSMFLPWFGTDATLTLPGTGRQVTVADSSLNAWQAFSGEDFLLAATGTLAILLIVLPARERPPLALVVIGAAALSALAIVLRLIYPPTIEVVESGDTVFETASRLGLFFGLLYTAAIAWGANRLAWRVEAPAAGEQPERPPGEPALATGPAPQPAPRSLASPNEPPQGPAQAGVSAQAAQAVLERPTRSEPVPAAGPAALAQWTRAAIEEECSRSWRSYDQRLADRYADYFTEHPELRGHQRFSARDLEAALPPGWGELASAVPEGAWQRNHLSGKSSQTLTVGLLGAAALLEPSLDWFFERFAPVPEPGSGRLEFEHTVEPELLGERPRQTTIDVLAEHPRAVVCVETKWREAGLEACPCRGDRVGPLDTHCSRAVEERAPYWQTAGDVLGLERRRRDAACPISPSYQAVRTMAAARALAGPDRLAVAALVYDAENPYFGGQGKWPGWPAVLSAAVAAHSDRDRFRFVALSWQELASRLPLDEPVRAWAAEKHGLS